jgi:hypothetical protein
VLVLRGLSPLPPDQTYQLWLLLPGNNVPPLPADLINVTDVGAHAVSITIPAGRTNLVGVGVSIEPFTGSATPTTLVLLGTEPSPSA